MKTELEQCIRAFLESKGFKVRMCAIGATEEEFFTCFNEEMRPEGHGNITGVFKMGIRAMK